MYAFHVPGSVSVTGSMGEGGGGVWWSARCNDDEGLGKTWFSGAQLTVGNPFPVSIGYCGGCATTSPVVHDPSALLKHEDSFVCAMFCWYKAKGTIVRVIVSTDDLPFSTPVPG